MSQPCVVSMLSTHPVTAPGGVTEDGLIDFWRKQCERVLPDQPDLLVLPETSNCFRHFTSPADLEHCERTDARLLEHFVELARKQRCWVALPTYRRDEAGKMRNSIRLIDRKGNVAGIYDKNFPTISEMEVGVVPSDRAEVVETEFGRVALVICFDLNFAELRQQYVRQRPNLILFCSMYHGGHVQRSWAYECRAYFVSAVADLPSSVCSPLGDLIATTTNYTPHVTTSINLDCCVAHLDGNFDKLSAMKQHYGPEVDIHDPGLLAPVLITSRSDQSSAPQMAAKFGIELLNEYLERSRAARRSALEQHS